MTESEIKPGWTRIADRLPGDDVEDIFVANNNGIEHINSAGIGWSKLPTMFADQYVPPTHWRVVPAEFFPLPPS